MDGILSRMKILIATETRTATTLKWVLSGVGVLLPFEAEDGLAAARIIAAGVADLAFIDDDLPVLNGIEVIKMAALHAGGGRPSPAVLLSTNPERWYIEQASGAGAFDYAGKPIDARRILAIMARRAADLPTIHADSKSALREPAPQTVGGTKAGRGHRPHG